MSATPTSMTLSGRPCVVPKRGGWNLGYLCPLGQTPGYAACLMTLAELSQLNREADQTLRLTAVETVTIPGLIFVKATKVSRSYIGDPKGLYLVELADRRLLLERFSDTRRQFNIWNPRQRAANAENIACYYAETLDGSQLWTWQRVAQALWTDCALLGSFSFPSGSVSDKPKNLHYWGVNAWQALHEVLEMVGLTTAYDPVAATFSIVALGQIQAAAGVVANAAANRYYGSADPIESNRARYPAEIKVYFPRRDRHFGTERDSVSTGNWITEPARASVNPTGVSGAQAGTVLQLWDQQPSIYHYSGFAENTIDTNAIGTRRKNDWLADQQYSESRAQAVYSGIVAGFRCGSQVKAVHWRLTADGDPGGYLTEVSRHPGMPESLHTPRREAWSVGYRRFGPEFSRHATPHYPDSMQLVQLTLQQSNYATWSGTVCRLDPAITLGSGPTFSGLESCFVQFINKDAWRVVPTSVPETTSLHTRVYKPKAGERYLARANGVTTSVGDVTLPLYTARLDNPQTIWWAELYEDVDAGTYAEPAGPFTAKLIVPQAAGAPWLDTGLTLTKIYNTAAAFASGTRVALYFDLEADLFHVLGAAGTGTTIRLAKLRASLYPCTDPGDPEGPVTADLYDCTVEAPGEPPVFSATGDTVELWNVLQNYYQKNTFAEFAEIGCGAAMVVEGYRPTVHLGVLASPLASFGTSNAILSPGEPNINVTDPFSHPIDASTGCAFVYDWAEEAWYAVQVGMHLEEMVCEVICNGGNLEVAYRDVRIDYTIEDCPQAAPSAVTAEGGSGLALELLSAVLEPAITSEYVDLGSLASWGSGANQAASGGSGSMMDTTTHTATSGAESPVGG